MLKVRKEKIENYAYNGYYITETPKGFVVESARVGRFKVFTGATLVQAKIFIDEIDAEKEKGIKQAYMNSLKK